MKKLMFAAVAALACTAFAEETAPVAEIPSENIVGYNTTTINKGETKMLAVSFGTTEDAAPIPVKKLATASAGFVGSTSASAADQIWTYSQSEGWKKYYYYKTTRAPAKEYWAVIGTTDEILDSVTVSAGTAIFYVRSNSQSSVATDLTFAGGVVDIKAQKSVEIAKGETKLICNPWPIEIAIKDFNSLYSNESAPIGSTSASAADQIWLYDQTNGWTKYYYYKTTRAPAKEYWAKIGGTSEIDPEKDIIEAGAGFFFVRSNSQSSTVCTLTFKGPEVTEK